MPKLRFCVMLPALLPLLGGCGVFSGGETMSAGRVGPRVADAMLRAGDAAAALRVSDGMLAADPQDSEARARRGQALLALGRPAEAADDIATASRARPGDVAMLATLAAARAAAGESASAEPAWRAVLAQRPGDRQGRIGLAVSLDLQGRHPEAQALYREVLRERPDDSAANADLGLSLALSGRPQEAVGYLERAGGPRARHDLAVALVLAGDEARARAVLSQDMNPTEVTAAIEGVRALGQS